MASPLDELIPYPQEDEQLPQLPVAAPATAVATEPMPVNPVDTARAGIEKQQSAIVSQIPFQNRWGRRNLESQLRSLNLKNNQLNRAESQQKQQNRLKAADLRERGIPTFTNASGGVSEVADESGTPLSHLDKAHNIAWDSQGQPRSISYDSDVYGSPPNLTDPFANSEPQTDKKTGDIYQKRAGLPWKWLGKDADVEAANLQADKDRAIKSESALIGQRLSLDHADLVAGEREHNAMTKELIGAVPSLQDPRFAGADRDTILKGIDDHFNSEYGSPAANEKNGWFSKELSPQAQKLRGEIDTRKNAAMELANSLYDLKDRQLELGDTVQAEHQARRNQIDTLLAHQQGQLGPLDKGDPFQVDPSRPDSYRPDGTLKGPGWLGSLRMKDGTTATELSVGVNMDGTEVLIPALVPTLNLDQVNYLLSGHKPSSGIIDKAVAHAREQMAQGKSPFVQPEVGPDQMTPDNVTKMAQTGHIPDQAAPAAVAAAHDAQDAMEKAKALENTDPSLADQFKAAAQGILHGLAGGVADIIKGLPAIEKYSPAGLAAAAAGLKPQAEIVTEPLSKTIREHAEMGYDKTLQNTIGGHIGNFAGGALPFVATSLIQPEIGVPLTVSTLFSAGYGSTKEDALAHGADDATAEHAALASGVVNGILGLPFRGIGGALRKVFGGASAPVIKQAIEGAFEREGPAAAGKLIDQLKGYVQSNTKPVIQGVAQDVRAQIVAALESIKAETLKTAAQRTATVAKHMAAAGAVGGGVQTAQNIIAKTYDPERGLFEGVPEQALGFAALAGVSHGFDQVLRARRAKAALDEINRSRPPSGGPALPPEGGIPEPPPAPPTPPPAPAAPEPKQAKGRVVEPTPEGEQDVSTQTGPREGQVSQPVAEQPARGGQPTPQPKLPAPATEAPTQAGGPEKGAEAGPVSTPVKPEKVQHGEFKQTGYTAVDTASHEAATSPTNEKPQPTTAQQKAGNYAKGKVQVGPQGNKLDVSIENPAGSQRSNLDTGKLNELAHETRGKIGTDLFGQAQDAVEEGDYSRARERIQAVADYFHRQSAQKGYEHLKDLAKKADTLLEGTFSTPMKGAHYGYIKGTVGADKDHVDAFIKEGTPPDYDGPVFVVDRTNKTGKFDEHKVIIGAKTHEEAIAVHNDNYDASHRDMYSGVTKFDNMADFKKWLSSGVKGPAAQSKGVALAPVEHPISKQVAAAFEKHRETLEALGHPPVPKITDKHGNVGANIFFHPESGIIHVNPEGLAENTKGVSEHARQRYIDRAIDEEIKHLATHKWAKASPENAQQIVKIGNEKDGIDKILRENYQNWDRLNASAKGYEKIRFVLQDRKPTEIAAQFGGKTLGPTLRDALRKIFKFINDLPGQMSPALKSATDAIRNILKGEEPETPSRETSPTAEAPPSKPVGKVHPRFVDPDGKTHTLYGYGVDVKISKTGEGGKYRAHGSGWEWYAFSPIRGDIIDGFVHGFEDEWGSFSLSELKEAGVRFVTDPEKLAGIAPPVGWKTAEGKTSVNVRGKMGQPPGISSREPGLTEFEKRRKQRVDLTERVGKLATVGKLPAKDQMVLRTLLQYATKKEPSQLQLDQAGRILDRLEGEPNAKQPSDAQVEGGKTEVGEQVGPGSEKPRPGRGDNVVGETEGTGPRGEISRTEEKPAQTEPAGRGSGVPTLADLKAKLREQERGGVVDDRLLQQIRELEAESEPVFDQINSKPEGVMDIPVGAEVEVVLNGKKLVGTMMDSAGVRWVDVKNHPTFWLKEADSIKMLRSPEEYSAATKSEREAQKYGEQLYPQPKTRDEYEDTLWKLAKDVSDRAVGFEDTKKRQEELEKTGGYKRTLQIEAQFNRFADQIELSKSKRRYMISQARNKAEGKPMRRAPTLNGNQTVYNAPKPQDFDPSKEVRSKRHPRPLLDYMTKAEVEGSLASAREQLANKKTTKSGRRQAENIVREREQQLRLGNYLEAAQEREKTRGVKGVETGPKEPVPPTSGLDKASEDALRDAFEGLGATAIKPALTLRAPAIRLSNGEVFESNEFPLSHAQAQSRALAERGAFALVVGGVEKGYVTTTGLFLTEEQAHKLTGRKIKTSVDLTYGTLGATTIVGTLEQKPLPPDKLPAFITLAQKLTAQGVDSPAKLVRAIDGVIGEKGRPYLQALWDAIGMVNPALRGTHDWKKEINIFVAAQAHKEEPEERDDTAIDDELERAFDAANENGTHPITEYVKARLVAGNEMPRAELTKLAERLGEETKQADELAERGVVLAVREVAEGATPENEKEKFDQISQIYENQPNLTAKTATSKLGQAYSTPAPLAFVASRIADVSGGERVYEPTAGNGMLLIETKPNQTVYANELESGRNEFLGDLAKQSEGNWVVSQKDATKHMPTRTVDRIVENPPFGRVADEEGEKKSWPLFEEGQTTKQIDHAIVAASLDALEHNGRAVLVIGGFNAVDPAAREKAYAANPFYKQLYEHYRVIDHFTVDGDLYRKQGAGWPVDFIVISGYGTKVASGKPSIRLPSAKSPRIISSWNELKNELGRSDADRIEAGRFTEAEAANVVSTALGEVESVTQSGGRSGQPRNRPPTDRGTGRGEGGGRPAHAPESEPGVPERGGPAGSEPATGTPTGGGPAGTSDVEHEQRGQLGVESQPYPEPEQAQYRIPYKPKSKHSAFGIFIPKNLEDPVRQALEKVATEVGDIDKYVREKLGYKPNEKFEKYFSAEQVDGLALMIYAAENGSAGVIGDQGGVGKGRMAAGMMLYAIEKGWIPVFLTRDPKLYAAMLEDLDDIGRGDLKPFFTNNAMSFKDHRKQVWRTRDQTAVVKQVAESGELPVGTQILFSSYFQIQSDVPADYYKQTDAKQRRSLKASGEPPPDGPKMEMFKKIAPNALFIMDESHMAAGDSIRAWRLNPLLASAPAAYYSSATFAKRPDSMGIYFRTSLNRAAPTMEELVSALSDGGVPLQQAVIAMLAEDGLYIRRERDFSNTDYHTHINLDSADRDLELADAYTGGLRKILGLSNDIAKIAGSMNKLIKNSMRAQQLGKARAPRLEATNFAALIHNMVSQYLFAIKAKSAVDRALYHIGQGRRVVIAFQNTMQSAIEALRAGGYEMSFKGLLKRYMDGQRELTSGRGANKQTITIKETPEPEFENTSDDMLKRMLVRFETDAEGQRVPVVNEAAAGEYFRRQANFLFVQVGAFLEDLELGDMPLSPIDYIHNALRDAGIQTVEITGRKTGLDRDGKTPIEIKGNSKAQQVEYMKQFNNGDAQALLMNGSGSTGISLHASEKFDNKEQRALLVIQPHLDINEFMQTTWRVDRTGQVVGPVIEVIQTAIPAELRPAAVLERKMGSLNANTTSNAKNEMKEQDTDIFNEFGDEVVHQYLASDPYFVEMLGWPKLMKESKSGESEELKTLEEIRDTMEDGQLVAGVTGRLAILPTGEGDEFWRQVTANYKTLMKYLDQTGQNTLTVAAIDMKAETLGKRELTPGNPEGESAFDGPSTIEHVRGQVGKEPRPGQDVLDKADEALREQPQIFAQWNEAANTWEKEEHARRMQNEIRNLSPKEEQEALDQISTPEGSTIDDVARQRALEIYVEEHKIDAWVKRTREARDQIANAIGLIGETVHIHNDRGLEAYGAVESAKLDLEAPLTPSKQEFTVWVNTTQRQIHLSAPQLNKDSTTTQRDHFVQAYEDTAERSNERYIITGNLLAGSVAITGQVQGTRVITFTDKDSRLRQGILMPVKFNPGTFIGRQAVTDANHARQLLEDGRTLMSKNQALTIVKRTSGVYELRVPASGTGKPVWGDYVLRQWMDKHDFVQKGSSMVGQFQASMITYVFNRITGTEDQAGGLETPLFFNKPVEDQPETLGATVPAFARDYWTEDVKPKLANAKATMKEVVDAAVHVLSPTFGVNKDVVDQVHKLLGERNQVAYVVDRTGEAFQKMFDSMSKPDQVTFVDRVKLGEDQPTPELEEAARFIRKVDAEAWEGLDDAAKQAGVKNPVKWLDNHYRVMWKKIPNSGVTRGGTGGGRAPLRGSRGMAKQHTLETMSEGIEAGGEPYSYNPIVNLKTALADIWKYTTALKLWAWGKQNHFVEFVRGPFPKLPEGMVWVNDSIADVWFPAESGEGLVHGGRYAAEEGFGRLLNNFLSKDHIRATRTGRTLMWIKNWTTQLELALSLFHGVFETAETVGSGIGVGLSKMYNRGILKGDVGAFMQGMADVIKSPATPVTIATLGAKFREMAGRPDEFWQTPEGRAFLQIHPDARDIIGYLFSGGFKPIEIEADWKNASIRAFMDSLRDLKSGSSSNYVGAGLRAFPAASEFLMKPLFDVYIPNLKIGQFVVEMREALRQNNLKYGASGYYIDRAGRRHDRPTNAELARKIWRLVEDRFGELNYDTLFWNQTFKAAMQLLFRSVTWKLGSIEAFGGAFAGQGKEFINAFKERRAPELHRNMAWLFGIFLLTAALGTIISVALGKHKPKNATDLVFPRIDPDDPRVRVSLPTYFKDLVHAVHSPTGYVKASLAGWIGRVAELLSNKDYYGVQVRDTDAPATKQAIQMGAHTAQGLLPFSIRGYKNLSSSQENTLRKMLAVIGINPAPRYIGQTPAERKVEEFWQGQRSETGIKPEQFEAQKAKRELVAKLRKGQNPSISAALQAGTIKPRDVTYLYKRASMGPLAAGIDKMPLEDAEKVYAKASPEERAQLAGIIARKRANSQRRQGKTMYAGF